MKDDSHSNLNEEVMSRIQSHAWENPEENPSIPDFPQDKGQLSRHEMSYLYLSVFTGGLCSMAVEMTASRQLSNIFSAANLVWACVIGSILVYLAIGNWLGGKLADRVPGIRPFTRLLLLCGALICCIPIVSKPFLSQGGIALEAFQIHRVIGFFLITLALLLIPMTALGMITPFGLALLTNRLADRGSISGKVLAISTVGSVIGTLLPVFVTIPRIGTARSFFLFGGLLMILAVVGILRFSTGSIRRISSILLLLPVVLFLFGSPAVKTTPGQIYEKESAYSYIEILNDNGYAILKINEGQAIQSIYHPEIKNYYGPWEQILSAPFFNPPPVAPADIRKAAILGLAGGTSASQLLQAFPEVEIDGYELDPEIIRAAEQYMDLRGDQVNIHLTDGRLGLAQSTHAYDIIMVDAYQPPYVSPNMCTVSFFEMAGAKLSKQGVLVMNIGRTENNRQLIEAIVSTAGQVFPSLQVVDLPNAYNSIIFASFNPISPDNLRENYDLLSAKSDVPSLLLETLSYTIGNLRSEPEEPGLIFSDDFVPVDKFTNAILLDSFLGITNRIQKEDE